MRTYLCTFVHKHGGSWGMLVHTCAHKCVQLCTSIGKEGQACAQLCTYLCTFVHKHGGGKGHVCAQALGLVGQSCAHLFTELCTFVHEHVGCWWHVCAQLCTELCTFVYKHVGCRLLATRPPWYVLLHFQRQVGQVGHKHLAQALVHVCT